MTGRHGTVAAYTAGCSCETCRAAWRDYHKARRANPVLNDRDNAQRRARRARKQRDDR